MNSSQNETNSKSDSSPLILVVDDDQVTVKLLKKFITIKGYRVETGRNGEDCLKKAKELSPDIILLDISMPVMDGIEACKILKKEDSTKDIPVIFVTSHTDDDTLNATFNSGGADYIRKPVNRVELMVRIKSVLTQEKLKKELIEKEKLEGVLEMAGAICHEVRQPLQVLYAYMEIIKDATAENMLSNDDIEKIKGQLQRLNEITIKISRIRKYESLDYLEGVKIIDIDKASLT